MDRLIRAVLIPLAFLGVGAAAAAFATGGAGLVRIAGADALLPLVESWGLHFDGTDTRVRSEGKGPSTGPPALLDGRANIASMTRPMNDHELRAFHLRFGHEPTATLVAADAVAVYVHASNPLERLTLTQVDAIFSTTRRCGGRDELRTWGDLGLAGDWAERNIILFGRHRGSGTRAFVRNAALCRGQFRDSVRESPGRASAVMAIAETRYGIGYGGQADRIPGVKPLALARRGGEAYATLDPEDVYSGAYPLVRPFLLYVNRAPGAALDASVAAFLTHALSDEGQKVVEQSGYLRVPPALVEKELAALR